MTEHISKEAPLKIRLQQIINSVDIHAQRALVSSFTDEMGIDSLTCAAALLYLMQPLEQTAQAITNISKQAATVKAEVSIKMVRYRLDVGSKHHITLEQLKKVLVDESGVDKKHINNVNIQSLYTLIELPDEMPPDIFQHLKSVEINQQKLDIKRVKARNNKKRRSNHIRRGRKRDPKTDAGQAGQASCNNSSTD
ncbi:MAG: DbpA RNA binding domain-containing protein [Methylococcales bacterium]|nr:DbpA RNA binding domain-containing protein [Methylococcales bacterium]